MTKRNLDLETDHQWQAANLTVQARRLLIARDLTAWFLRLPGQTRTFATLVEFGGYHTPNNRAFRQATFDGPIPLTTDAESDRICMARRHVSIVEGRVVLYLNATHEIWMDVGYHLDWLNMPPEDRAALLEL